MEPTRSPSLATFPFTLSILTNGIGESVWIYLLRFLRQVGWMLVVFLAFVIWVSVRMECQQLQKDLHRNRREIEHTKVQTEQLSLELASRRSIGAVERKARANGIQWPAHVISISRGPAVLEVADVDAR